MSKQHWNYSKLHTSRPIASNSGSLWVRETGGSGNLCNILLQISVFQPFWYLKIAKTWPYKLKFPGFLNHNCKEQVQTNSLHNCIGYNQLVLIILHRLPIFSNLAILLFKVYFEKPRLIVAWFLFVLIWTDQDTHYGTVRNG